MTQSTSRFRLPKTASEEEICCLRAVPKSTKYINKWSVKILEEWQRERTVKVPVLDVAGISLKITMWPKFSRWLTFRSSICNNNNCHFKSQTNNNNN